MQFVFQALTWGFLLTLVPVLIHLINMMRHRRVKWAAMEFLLQSYKRHRHWVWLKQLLLLLMRMAAIALLVAMLAQWKPAQGWLSQLGGRETHHYVLLDDSYSMSEQMGGNTAFDLANQTIARIAAEAIAQEGRQRFTLIRFAQAAHRRIDPESVDIGQIADLNAEIVDVGFDVVLEEKRRTFEVTQLAVGPRPALEMLRQLVEQDSAENQLVYLLSDFRVNQWRQAAELRQLLLELDRSVDEMHLIACSRQPQANLAVLDVEPTGETQAAGVPLFVKVRIKNFGSVDAKGVQLKMQSVSYPREAELAGQAGAESGQVEELPIELIERLAAGETVQRRVQVVFSQAGKHVVQAMLPEDPVPADNLRWCVLDVAEGESVLVVDGDPEQRNAFYLSSIFQPGQRANTGIRPQLETPVYLRDTPLQDLQGFAVIYLMDVERLDPLALERLEQYVRQGGGLAIFMGPQVNFNFYNDTLYRNGDGLMPLPLERDVPLPPPLDEETPDIDIEGTTHPVFRDLLLGRNPIIRMVKVDRYLQPPESWQVDPDSTVRVVARLHNQDPLVLEHRLGQGRVIVFLTTYYPGWNDLVLGPNVLVALKLQSYLASARQTWDTRVVGAPLQLELNRQQFRKDVKFVVPGSKPETRVVIDRTATSPDEQSPLLRTSIGGPRQGTAAVGETDRSGVYEAWAMRIEGSFDVRRYALNVDPLEGDLAILPSRELLTSLEPMKPVFRYADEYQMDSITQAEFNPSMLLMSLLICLLLGEQIMAYATSFHPVRGSSA